MNPPENAVAFGAPGIEPRWTWSEKEDIAIAITPVAAFGSRSVTASSMRFTIQAAIAARRFRYGENDEFDPTL
jgi:hypothetical protein